MQHFMKAITTIFLITIFFSANCQETKTKEKELTFKNQGEQENYWAKQLFSKKYTKQNYSQFEGNITIVDENTIKYDDEVLLVYNTGNELKKIFEKGIFYPRIITGPVKTGDARKADLESMLIRDDSLIITDFEEQTFLSNSPKVKRFKFWLFMKGAVNPTVYFIELTNESATTETKIESFINGARLTFFVRGWRII